MRWKRLQMISFFFKEPLVGVTVTNQLTTCLRNVNFYFIHPGFIIISGERSTFPRSHSTYSSFRQASSYIHRMHRYDLALLVKCHRMTATENPRGLSMTWVKCWSSAADSRDRETREQSVAARLVSPVVHTNRGEASDPSFMWAEMSPALGTRWALRSARCAGRTGELRNSATAAFSLSERWGISDPAA